MSEYWQQRAEPVRRGEHLPPGPFPAHPLALDRAGHVGREDHPVVLVGLVDDAALVVLHEVAGQAEVVGGQVREPVRGHLVGHREHVAQVLHGQVAGVLGGGQEPGRGLLGHQHRGREVVRLHPLAQEVREVPRRGVAEHEVAQGLQQHRARRVRAHGLLLEVDPPVPQVGHGPRGARQVVHVPDGEPVVADHREQQALGQRAALVADRARASAAARSIWREVVAALAHHGPQVRVGLPGLLRRGRRLDPLPAQFGVQGDDVLEHVGGHPGADPQRRQAEIAERRGLLGLGQRDLQLGPAAGRLLPQQFRGGHRQRLGQGLDQGQLGLAAAVLQQGQHARGPAHLGAELGQGEAAGLAGVPEALAEQGKIGSAAVPAGHRELIAPSIKDC